MISISRPIHKNYALCSIDDSAYIKFLNGYSTAKKVGVKGVWLYLSGEGYYNLVKEVACGTLKNYGKKKLASSIIAFATWSATPLVPLITNSTKIIKVANATHTAIAFVAETFEDCTNLAWLPLDLALVGQPIPIGPARRYNLMGGDNTCIPFLGDGD